MALIKVQRVSDGKVIWIPSEKMNPDQYKSEGTVKKTVKRRGKKNADSN